MSERFNPAEGVFYREAKWYPRTFRNYYKQTLLGEIPVLQSKIYPKEIAISEDAPLTRLHMRLREETRDGNERWGMIGYDYQEGNIVFSEDLVVGTRTGVSAEAIRQKVAEKQKNGTYVLFGGQHSHSVNYSGEMVDSFSANDLYALLPKGDHQVMQFLVAGENLLFVTRAADSSFVDADLSQESFRKYWVNKIVQSSTPSKAEEQIIMHEIIKEHNLVLYKGKIGESIYRVNPSYDPDRNPFR